MKIKNLCGVNDDRELDNELQKHAVFFHDAMIAGNTYMMLIDLWYAYRNRAHKKEIIAT